MRIRMQELEKTYADADRKLGVINRVSFNFPEHTSVAIVGKSGVGKSTLLHMLGGLDRPTSGAVFYDDLNISALSPDELAALRAKKVGFIFQFHHLMAEFSALENVCLPLLLGGSPENEALERSQALLCRLGLGDRLEHSPAQLSGGEQQRVAIARAVVTQPSLILADEPTGNLDPQTSQIMQDLLLELHRELKTTLIIVTHNAELASALGLVLEMLPGGELRVK